MNNTLYNAPASIKVLHQKDERLIEPIRKWGCNYLVDCFCINSVLQRDMDSAEINGFYLMAVNNGVLDADCYITDHDRFLTLYCQYIGESMTMSFDYMQGSSVPFLPYAQLSDVFTFPIFEMSGNGTMQHFVTPLYDPMHGDCVCDQIESVRTLYISFYNQE